MSKDDVVRRNAADVRAAALGLALRTRAEATHDDQVEYSEAVGKLRERFEGDISEALQQYRRSVLAAHRACNAAMIKAESDYATAVGQRTFATRRRA